MITIDVLFLIITLIVKIPNDVIYALEGMGIAILMMVCLLPIAIAFDTDRLRIKN